MSTITFSLDVDGSSKEPLFLLIAKAVIRDIRRGRLTPETRLPGTRTLAQQLSVNRNTVDAAYQELIAQGWAETRPASGTYISRDLPQSSEPSSPSHSSLPPGRSTHSSWTKAPPLSFNDGTPDTQLMPSKALARAFRGALMRPDFQRRSDYRDGMGDSALRQALSDYLTMHRGKPYAADHLMVTRGSQMALYLSGRTLLSPGDTIAMEDPGYPQARDAFLAAGAHVTGIPVDAKGICIESLENALNDNPKIRAVYITPHHQYPTTVTLGAARRLKLLELVQRYDIVLIEDDYDHEYHFEGRPVHPIDSIASEKERVIYIGSLSKLLTPGIRVGYVHATPALLDPMLNLRSVIDRQGDTPLEMAIAELMTSGELTRHTRKSRQLYRSRRDAMADALRTTFGDAVDFDLPTGGLATWARLPNDVDVHLWAHEAERLGVSVTPGAHFAIDAIPPRAFRLGYAAMNHQQIQEAVGILARAYNRTRRS
ncbi:MocR-like pyridoxine biosynthesis transcription factor PdxR [Chromohalobacter japonicus]|uniref:MocR-like pyridoxine biosynthesis transcription factor PdxR n=1 Tax=Chromohalobacter japonicus TaxID=223900 RepID=UPI003F8E441B